MSNDVAMLAIGAAPLQLGEKRSEPAASSQPKGKRSKSTAAPQPGEKLPELAASSQHCGKRSKHAAAPQQRDKLSELLLTAASADKRSTSVSEDKLESVSVGSAMYSHSSGTAGFGEHFENLSMADVSHSMGFHLFMPDRSNCFSSAELRHLTWAQRLLVMGWESHAGFLSDDECSDDGDGMEP